MPYYRTGVLRDAWIRYEAVVEASSAQSAADMAELAWDGDDNGVFLEEWGVTGFDYARPFSVAEITEVSREEYDAHIKRYKS